MTSQLQAGKSYHRRDGRITAPLVQLMPPTPNDYCFKDPATGDTYSSQGIYDVYASPAGPSGLDLVLEVPGTDPDFVGSFRFVQYQAHEVNVANGWWADRHQYLQSGLPNARVHTFCALVGLVHTELSEAIEAARKHTPEQWRDASIKDTMVRELAGAVVRIMDIAAGYQLPLAEAIVAEIEANKARGHRHGGKAA